MTKAIALLSGGLDSTLAIRLLLDQNIQIEAVYCRHAFGPGTGAASPSAKAAKQLGVPLTVIDISEELLEIVKNPPHGYGSNMNPCIDCHIFMFRKAAERMKETGASFLATGEVLGERPMSQRLDALRLIEKETGLEGRMLRPLSAKLLPPTIPEEEGLVDRERLLAIQGRTRKKQLALAKQYGITEYPTPAGGCLLTDPQFAGRMKELMEHNGNFGLNDVELLRVGRHFRTSQNSKLIVGRNKEENEKILNLAREGDYILEAVDHKGPISLLRSVSSKDNPLSRFGERVRVRVGGACLSFAEDLRLSAGITASYGKGKDEQKVKVSCKVIASSLPISLSLEGRGQGEGVHLRHSKRSDRQEILSLSNGNLKDTRDLEVSPLARDKISEIMI